MFLWGVTSSNIYLTDLQEHWAISQVYPFPQKETLCLCIFPRLPACTILSEKLTHQSSQPLHTKTQMFLKSRTNPNKTIIPDCPLLNSHWLARTWVIEGIKTLRHHHVTLSWNNKEEKLLIEKIKMNMVAERCVTGSLSGSKESSENLT